MKLEKNEYSISSLKTYLEKNFGKKFSGQPFTTSDIHSYIKRGYLPHRYGGNALKMKVVNGVKIVTMLKPIEV